MELLILSLFVVPVLAMMTLNTTTYTTLRGRGEHVYRLVMDDLLSAYRTARGVRDRINTSYECLTGNGGAAQIMFPPSRPTTSAALNFVVKRGYFFATEEKAYMSINRHLVVFPLFVDAMALVHTLRNTPQLSLTAQQIVGIFNLTVVNWSDQSLRTVGLNLPTFPADTINVWVRQDATTVDSEVAVYWMTQLIDRYMPADLPKVTVYPFLWKNNVMAANSSPAPQTGYHTGLTSLGVLSGVIAANNSIGLVSYADYAKNCHPEVGDCMLSAVPDSHGNLVELSAETVDGSSLAGTGCDVICMGYGVDSTYQPASVVNLIVYGGAPSGTLALDCLSQVETARFLRWVHLSQEAHAIIHAHYFYILNESAYDNVVLSQLKNMRCGPDNLTSVWDLLLQKLQDEVYTYDPWPIVAAVLSLVLIIILVTVFCIVLKRRRQTMDSIMRQLYVIPDDSIHVIKASREKYHCMMHFRKYLEGRHARPLFVVGEYRADVVMLTRLDMFLTNVHGGGVKLRLVRMIRDISHPNVVHFFGLTEHSIFQSVCFAVCQFCPLGDLRTALDNKRNELDAPIKVGMVKGIAEGLTYLHARGFVHGNLRSSVVFLEADWTTRISDWHVNEIENLMHKFRNRERVLNAHLSSEEEQVYFPPLLWSAPEILTAVSRDEPHLPTVAGDVYSFAVIVFEVMTRDLPYEYNNIPYSMSYEQLFAMIKREIRPIRPLDFKEPEQIALNIPKSIIEIMKAGWSADPQERPKMVELRNILRATSSEMKRLADLTIVNTRTQIEHYKRSIIKNSEETVELIKELSRTEADFLTQWVHDAEEEGHRIEPKFHQVVYVLHCSLVNYDGLCAVAHGDAVLYFANRFFHILDQVLPPDRNIHRLHPNGDSVTIVAAIPSGGVEYAAKMATLALDLLVEAWKADLLDIDWDRMEVRIGLACGPAVAGIYGNNHRAFTVTGIAHEEAQLAESASAPYRILLTEAFYEALKVYPDYTTVDNLDDRHTIPHKHTYWLQGQERYRHQKTLDDIEKLYPPIVHGCVPDVGRAAQSRVRIKQKHTKLSVQTPVGFYIQKDHRSGYTIEHYPEGSRDRPLKLATIHEHADHHRLHHVGPSHSQSRLFGSMLGPQGFAPYRNYKKERVSLLSETEPVDDSQFVGQMGLAGIKLPVIVNEEEEVDEAVQVRLTGSTGSTEELEIRASAMEIVDDLSRNMGGEDERKKRRKKDREESLVEVIRKTSLWVAQLPEPGSAPKETDDESEESKKPKKKKKKERQKSDH
ncbi:uncharacterized protein LOC129590364 [Paramacrobiotus metropolitanus]|uniref:uncharacterized protein LOC129590364 n=1 Tax=Paramacrobiotus metropolitanus TaxID=2943436 RepID=UPI002445D230|nr:uncharacterized protein LOC129590364 [Paramacrobiotus metropolitanus]